MTFGTLKDIDLSDLLIAFNDSFKGYIVPLNISFDQLKRKIHTEQIDLSLSPAVFNNGLLVGFILHGSHPPDFPLSIYNAGTGIIPGYRGNGLTLKMYDFILPKLKELGAHKILLEVITTNAPAITVYEKVGFNHSRKLDCFRGSVNASRLLADNIEVLPLKEIEWSEMQQFWDWKPTWQNASHCLEKQRELVRIDGIYKNRMFCGYVCYNPVSGSVHQFAIKKQERTRGLGHFLFESIFKTVGKDLTLVNIDIGDLNSTKFLRSIGLTSYISQYEMMRILN